MMAVTSANTRHVQPRRGEDGPLGPGRAQHPHDVALGRRGHDEEHAVQRRHRRRHHGQQQKGADARRKHPGRGEQVGHDHVRIAQPPRQDVARVESHRDQQAVDQHERECRDPHAPADRGAALERVEARQLARLHGELDGAREDDPERDRHADAASPAQQRFGRGVVRQRGGRFQSPGGCHHAPEEEDRGNDHHQSLHGIRLHHGDEAAGDGVEHHDEEHDDDRRAVGDVQEHLQEVADPLEDRGHVEERGEDHDHRRQHPRGRAAEPEPDEVGDRERSQRFGEGAQAGRDPDPRKERQRNHERDQKEPGHTPVVGLPREPDERVRAGVGGEEGESDRDRAHRAPPDEVVGHALRPAVSGPRVVGEQAGVEEQEKVDDPVGAQVVEDCLYQRAARSRGVSFPNMWRTAAFRTLPMALRGSVDTAANSWGTL